MARPYSQKFLLELYRNEANSLGVNLARLCVNANLPATYVAAALETTRTTVYSWFRGQGIREHKRKVVEVFIDLLKEDFKSGVLPVANLDDAQEYIEAMTGKKVH